MSSKFEILVYGAKESGKTTLARNLAFLFENNETVEVHENASHLLNAAAILVPTLLEEAALNQTQDLLKNLYEKVPKEIVYVILNQYNPKEKVNPHEIKEKLKCNILGALPYDPAILESEKEGVAFVQKYPKSIAAKYLNQLVQVIETKKILERGYHVQTAGTALTQSLKATGTEGSRVSEFPSQIPAHDPKIKLKRNILDQLISELNLKKLDTETGNDPKKMALLRQKTQQAILSIMERDNIHVGDRTETRGFIKDILDEALGLGALERLLADPDVTEIMVNRKDQIYIEKNGKVQLAPLAFTSNKQLLGVIERIVAPLGRRIDEKTPYVDARLPDGSRVHAIIPPLALDGPMITIRKFSKRPFIIQDLMKFGSLNDEMTDFLRAAIESRRNIVVSGGTGTGKTTLLNVLSSFIPKNERIITVEDSAELRLTQPHVCRLESRPPNIEGKGAITIRDLVRNTLRMRPDRIVVGECRDGAALDMLQAMNTGHDGSMTTIHANTPRDCLSRLETLVMMAGMDLPSRAIREQIGSAVNLIVQISRFSDGTRKITHISEVTGMNENVITLQDIFIFKQEGIDAKHTVLGKHSFTGNVPQFIQELHDRGLRTPKGFISSGILKRRKSD